MSVELDPRGNALVGPTKVGAQFGRSREWGRALLRQWWEEQQGGGHPRVLKRGKVLYTTMQVLRDHTPRARDEAVLRKLRELDGAVDQLYARVLKLEMSTPRPVRKVATRS